MPANYVSGYSYCILNKDTPKTNWEANFGCRQFLIQLGTSPCCRRTLALEMTGRTMSSPSELSSRVCPFLQTPMPAIPQACPASCSPLTPVCSFPVDSCVDTGHWCWARQTWSLFSWNLLFIARNLWLRLWFLIPARVGWCCGWTVVQSGVPVRSAFGLGEDGEGNNPGRIHHLVNDPSTPVFPTDSWVSACLFISLLLWSPSFPCVSLVIMRYSFNWPSNHSFV